MAFPTFNQIGIALDVLLWLYEEEDSDDPGALRQEISNVRDRLDAKLDRANL